jgi:hypothetical protein
MKGLRKRRLGKFHNTRPAGKPRKRWEDVVQRAALQILEVSGDGVGAEKNGDTFWWRSGPREGLYVDG